MPSTPPVTKICVFAASRNGVSAEDAKAARELAAAMHKHNIHLVYGGGTGGLMGEIARERVKLGGPKTVLGVTPLALMEEERGSIKDHKGKLAAMQQKGGQKQNKKKETGLLKGLKTIFGGKKVKKDTNSKQGVISLPTDPAYGQSVGTKSLSARKAYMIKLVKEAGPGSGFVALSGGFGTLDEVVEVVTLRQHRLHKCDVVLLNVEGFWKGLLAWMENGAERGFVRKQSLGMVKVAGTGEEAVELLRRK